MADKYEVINIHCKILFWLGSAETKILPNLQTLPDEIILLNIVFVTLSEGTQIPGLLSPWHVLKDLAILAVFAK